MDMRSSNNHMEMQMPRICNYCDADSGVMNLVELSENIFVFNESTNKYEFFDKCSYTIYRCTHCCKEYSV